MGFNGRKMLEIRDGVGNLEGTEFCRGASSPVIVLNPALLKEHGP